MKADRGPQAQPFPPAPDQITTVAPPPESAVGSLLDVRRELVVTVITAWNAGGLALVGLSVVSHIIRSAT